MAPCCRAPQAGGGAPYHLMVFRSLKNFGHGFVGTFADTDMGLVPVWAQRSVPLKRTCRLEPAIRPTELV